MSFTVGPGLWQEGRGLSHHDGADDRRVGRRMRGWAAGRRVRKASRVVFCVRADAGGAAALIVRAHVGSVRSGEILHWRFLWRYERDNCQISTQLLPCDCRFVP